MAESKPAGGGGAAAYRHQPVLCAEAVALLAPAPGRTLVDATLGGGGHAERLLAAGARVIGFDRDADAIAHAGARLGGRFGERFEAVHADFRELGGELARRAPGRVDGVLFDLGVSSWQLDSAARGFSFQSDGELDMRMDQSGAGATAAELVNTLPAADLAALFRRLGDERNAARIAREIECRRASQPLRRTRELAALVERASGGGRGRRHPATRVFQALRMAVNRELEALECALDSLPGLLSGGGRAAVISFHSLEDRMVKNDFRRRSQRLVDRPEWPAPRDNPERCYRLLTRKPVLPGEAELAANPRSRSARLRAVERM